MSTTMYMQCLSHDPPIYSDEVGQHDYDLSDIRKHIANRKLYEANRKADLDISYGDYWGNAAAYFLTQHPNCEIGIINQYGGTYLTGLDDDETEIREVKQ